MPNNPYPTRSGFGLRVHRAETAIRKLARDPYADIFTRVFDNCFEMYDGDAVVWALMDKATKEPDCAGKSELTLGIQEMFKSTLKGQKYPDLWRKIYFDTEQLNLF